MAPSPLVKKLGLKPGQRLLVLGAPDGYLDALGELPEGVALSSAPDGAFDRIQVFVRDAAEVARDGPTAMAALADGGALWFSYPKRSSGVTTDITRDRGWEALSAAGWRPVSQISIDETWSALRFRPEAEVKPRKRG